MPTSLLSLLLTKDSKANLEAYHSDSPSSHFPNEPSPNSRPSNLITNLNNFSHALHHSHETSIYNHFLQEPSESFYLDPPPEATTPCLNVSSASALSMSVMQPSLSTETKWWNNSSTPTVRNSTVRCAVVVSQHGSPNLNWEEKSTFRGSCMSELEREYARDTWRLYHRMQTPRRKQEAEAAAAIAMGIKKQQEEHVFQVAVANDTTNNQEGYTEDKEIDEIEIFDMDMDGPLNNN